MDATISSADPEALYRYADTAVQLAVRLDDDARRLASALQYFCSTCIDFSPGVGPELASNLSRHVDFTQPQDAWVRQVGQDFEVAGGLTWLNPPPSKIGTDLGLLSVSPGAGTYAQLTRILGHDFNEFIAGPMSSIQPDQYVRFIDEDKFVSETILEFRDIVDAFHELAPIERDGEIILHGSNDAREALELPLGLRDASDLTVAKDLTAGTFKDEFITLSSGTVGVIILNAGVDAYGNWEKYRNDDYDNRVAKTAVATIADTALDASLTAGGAVVGEAAGAALGAFLGPPGIFVGGFLGQLAGGWLGSKVATLIENDPRFESGVDQMSEGVVDAGLAARAGVDQAASTVADEIAKNGTNVGGYALDLISGAKGLAEQHPDKLLEMAINPVSSLF